LDKTETKLWASSDCEKTLAKMLENGSVNSETKDSPIMPILKTQMKKVTEPLTRLCTYVSSPNPEISLQNYYINRIKCDSIMNFI